MPKKAAILAYSQIREYEEADSRNTLLEALYKCTNNLAKLLAGKK